MGFEAFDVLDSALTAIRETVRDDIQDKIAGGATIVSAESGTLVSLREVAGHTVPSTVGSYGPGPCAGSVPGDWS